MSLPLTKIKIICSRETYQSCLLAQWACQSRPLALAWQLQCPPLCCSGRVQAAKQDVMVLMSNIRSTDQCGTILFSTSGVIWESAASVSASCSPSCCRAEWMWEWRCAEAVLVCLAWVKMALASCNQREKKNYTLTFINTFELRNTHFGHSLCFFFCFLCDILRDGGVFCCRF